MSDLNKVFFDPVESSVEFLNILAYAMDQMDTMVGVLDTEGTVLYANQAALRGVGAMIDKVRGVEFLKTPWRNYSFEAIKITKDMIKKGLAGKVSIVEDSVVGPDGKAVPMLFSISPVRDINGKIIALIPEGKVIAEQKNLHDKLKKEQWEIQKWIDSMGAFVAKCDREGRIITCNQPFLNLMGVPLEMIRGCYICDSTHLGHSSKTQKRLQQAVKNGRNGLKSNIEVTLTIGKNSPRTSLFSVSPIFDSSCKVSFLALEITDISEQVRLREMMIVQEKEYSRRLENEVNEITKVLKETEQFNKKLVASAPVGFIYLDEENRLLFANPDISRKLAKFGISKDYIKGKRLSEFGIHLAGHSWKKVTDPAGERINYGKMKMFFSFNGKKDLRFEVSAAPLRGSSEGVEGTILIMDDVTESNRLEEELLRSRIQSEKMRSIELLISGVAHELNNPLTSIIGCAEHLEVDSDLSNESREAARIIINDARRAGKIVKNLYNFTVKVTLQATVVNINDIIRTVIDIRMHEIKKRGIHTVLELDSSIRPVDANVTEMQQVLLNILRNSVNAIAESGTGDRIVVRTFADGDRLVMEVEDNGPGIPEECLTMIFDPFFTTRQQEKGTGLGLSLVYGIIKKHRGTITVDASFMSGTRFIIRLPFSDTLAATVEPKADRLVWIPSKVLAVDDEYNICVTISKHLTALGCMVDIANSGEKALEMIDSRAYDFLIVDIKMPGMNGLELYRRLRTIRPEFLTRFAFMTGISEQEKEDVIKALGLPVLQKPFSQNDVVRFLKLLEPNIKVNT